jgi:hypothetical protein
MARPKKFEALKGGEREPKRKSLFEMPRLPWKKEEYPKVHGKRAAGHFVGRLLLRASLEREKKEGKGEQKDLKTALAEKDVELKGLYGKKEELALTREALAKRFKDFREAEKVMGYALTPFRGERRELLLAALDHSLNPEAKDKKPLKPEEERAHREVLDGLDSRTLEEKRPAMHLAAFVYLKQEKIHEAEDQLNGTREQALDRQIHVAVAERNVTELLDTTPGIAQRVIPILHYDRLDDEQKARAIFEELAARGDARQRETVEGFASAFAESTPKADDLQASILDGERSLRMHRDAIAQAEGIAESERAIAQIPEEEAVRRGKAVLGSQDVMTEE